MPFQVFMWVEKGDHPLVSFFQKLDDSFYEVFLGVIYVPQNISDQLTIVIGLVFRQAQDDSCCFTVKVFGIFLDV